MRYGYHLTDCLKANLGKKSHKDVKATIIHKFNHFTNITATKPKPFPDGKQADIFLSGVTAIDNPAARNWHLDVTSTNPMGVTNQEFINRAALRHQRAQESKIPAMTSSPVQNKQRSANTPSTTASARQRGLSSHLPRSKRRAATLLPPSRCTCSSPSKRDLGLPADVLVGKLKKDTSFALRRGTITHALDAAQCAAEDEELLALDRRADGLGSLNNLFFLERSL